MAGSAHDATLPLPFRWLVFPVAVWSAIAAAAIVLRRRAQTPTLPPMSDEWLHSRMYDRSLPND
jgi:hypothetical protein